MELQIIIKEWKAVTKDRHYSQLWAVDIVLGFMGAPTTSIDDESLIRHEYGWDRREQYLVI